MTFMNIPASLDWPVQFCSSVTLATWVASLVTSNVSQVDRLWTFLPTIYTGYYAFLPWFKQKQSFFLEPYTPKELGWSAATHYSPRALLMFGLVFVWMCRLSYNTWRRGLFRLSDEDYRWAVLRSSVSPLLFQITNFVFISGIQNVLLLLLGLPARTAAFQEERGLTTSDYALAALALAILAVEFTADNQQFAFHSYKHAYLAKKNGKVDAKQYDSNQHWPGSRLQWKPQDAERGFITQGLWSFSRHPNFFCEQSFWWVISLFPLLSPGAPHFPSEADFPPPRAMALAILNPSLWKPLFDNFYTALKPTFIHLLPAISLSALFFFSTLFTESISMKKYPKAYRAYQKRVGMFAPTGTLWKGLVHRLTDSEQVRTETQRLVWGEVVSVDKTE